MTQFNLDCPYCQAVIEIAWEQESALWICDFCEHTFWVRRRTVALEQSERMIEEFYGVRMKVGGCCGGG